MRYFLIFLLLIIINVFVVPSIAQENNKFGIHLAVPATEQIEKTAELVNTNGGDWGYITLVIQEDDRNHEKWQEIFNKLRKLHLIPIVRLATKPMGPLWRRATNDDVDQWVQFLNGLNWVVKKRYIILFNETNHGQEWGGNVDAEDYARVAQHFAEKLTAKNPNFFVMLGGLDASAPAAAPNYADEAQYFKSVIDTIGVETFNRLFSGLSSHSYPNPGFVGSPGGSGRGSVRTYEWELALLQSWGIKPLPVFITETGWDGNKLSRQMVANNFKYVFENIWLNDDRVKAVTPFILDYQGDPFLGFSWRMLGSEQYYPQFNAVQEIPKIHGDPEIIQKGSITHDLPELFVVNSNYHFKVTLSNNGQAIWDENHGYRLALENFDDGYFFSDLNSLEPNQSSEVDVFFKSGNTPGKKESKITLYNGDKKVLESKPWKFEVVPLPKLDFRVSLFPRLKHKGTDFEIQVFDEKEQLVFKKKNIEVGSTKGEVGEVRNITLDKKYRVVVLKPYYLPRQTYERFGRGVNVVTFERMYPSDFNKDGKLDLSDIWALITHPSLISLWMP